MAGDRGDGTHLKSCYRFPGPRRGGQWSRGVWLGMFVGLLAVLAAPAAHAAPPIKIGFGVTNLAKDQLHLEQGFGSPSDTGASKTVAGYLHDQSAGMVHVRLPWCRIEPSNSTTNGYNEAVLNNVYEWVENANAGGEDTLISVDTEAPVFARTDAMQHKANGDTLTGSGCASQSPGADAVYPAGDPAPAATTQAENHYADAVEALMFCVAADPRDTAGCPNTSLLGHVQLELGDETNYWHNWQTGICENGDRWWQVGIHQDDGTYSKCNSAIPDNNVGRIDRTDADFYGNMVNITAQQVHQDFGGFARVVLGGDFMHSGQWQSAHPDGLDYLSRIYQRLGSGAGWDYASGRAWDKVGMHLGPCNGLDVTLWAGCTAQGGSGSVQERIDGVRNLLNTYPADDKEIWITGLLDLCPGECSPSDPSAGQGQATRIKNIWDGIVNNYCGGAHRVGLVTFARLPNPGVGAERNIGFMTAGGEPWTTSPTTWEKKPVYRTMNSELSSVNCQ